LPRQYQLDGQGCKIDGDPAPGRRPPA
jgi:hypothetical protein